MYSQSAFRPGGADPYPERREPRFDWAARLVGGVANSAHAWARWRPAHMRRFVAAVADEEHALVALDDSALTSRRDEIKHGLTQHGLRDDCVVRAFALIREQAARRLGMRHYGVQLIGGRVLLGGRVAEMETGEGKTLTATLAAATAALSGIPVHVITVNDYLAARDAAWMGPLYAALGLRVGTIVHGLAPEQRRAAYASDIVYGTNKEIAFDYLRDRLVLGGRPRPIHLALERSYGEPAKAQRLLMRGLQFAIVDEADSVLIDEARTPLIISAETKNAQERTLYETALALAAELNAGVDFVVREHGRLVKLTPLGRARLQTLALSFSGVWAGAQRREELVRLALSARHLYVRDQHYLVRDGKIQIVDEFTGRVMADRSWERGLHQMVEVKEGCKLTGEKDTLARISYQRFFRRYLRLAGMTGTAREVATELWAVYRLNVVSILTHRPTRRRYLPTGVYRSAEEKWRAVVSSIAARQAARQPVLIGTRSVAMSEHLSRLLTETGLAHRVLNARQDQEEAEIIAAAGDPGRITVATNMAGRGTDIRLAPGVPECGGLHVIATELHESQRVDRQLYGRCARQGDPGSCEALLSLEDELIERYAPAGLRWLGRQGDDSPRLWRRAARWLFRRAQRRAEAIHSHARRQLLKLDEYLGNVLAFSGRSE